MVETSADALIATLARRFAAHPERHAGLEWAQVAERLADNPGARVTLAAMEQTGGEPDVVGWDQATGQLRFCDCAPESPTGRRSLCYDQRAHASRKTRKPAGSAMGMARNMGLKLLTEAQYAALQQLGEFDLRTSSWLLTPDDVRDLGGALFGDRRFGRVFTYHNGAESYYAARGFRGLLTV